MLSVFRLAHRRVADGLDQTQEFAVRRTVVPFAAPLFRPVESGGTAQLLSVRASAARRPSHWPPTWAIQETAFESGAGVTW
jgi:hypothetical protein